MFNQHQDVISFCYCILETVATPLVSLVLAQLACKQLENVSEDLCKIKARMPVEITDFSLHPSSSSFIVQKALLGDAWRDLLYGMLCLIKIGLPGMALL